MTCSNGGVATGGFAPTFGSPQVSTAPYRETITLNGNLNEWDQNTWNNGGTNDDSAIDNVDEINGNGPSDFAQGDGLFTYERFEYLYFGFTTFGNNHGDEGVATTPSPQRAKRRSLAASCYPASNSVMVIYVGNGTSTPALRRARPHLGRSG